MEKLMTVEEAAGYMKVSGKTFSKFVKEYKEVFENGHIKKEKLDSLITREILRQTGKREARP